MKLAERAQNISPSPTLSIDAQAKKMIAGGIKVINFGVGEPDFDTPEHIKQAAVKAIADGMTKYTPVAGTDSLRRAIVKKLAEDNNLQYEPGQIVVSAGAKHSLYNAFQVLCQAGDEVILPAPYWVSYLEQIKLAGAKPVIVPTTVENDFKLTPAQLQNAITPNSRVIILNSPSNPTGSVYTREELAALGEILVKNNIIIISDEIYEKLIYDEREHVSIAALNPALKDLTVVINGVSKSYAMTGWRIGYAAAPQPVAKAMADLQSHSTSNPTSIAQAASLEALTGTQEPVRHMVVEFAKRRDYIMERLLAIPGVKCNRPGGAFYVFPEIKPLLGKSYAGTVINCATDLARVLLEKEHVAIVPGIAFGDDTCFRLSYATSMDNIREGLDLIEKVLTGLH
ncbi:pyridoxal phosphate-dependent aminotransferase [Desulfallas thermosapovorans]|uniref:Aminotransferase n=1 Tax=Desulfallas thermosapovorans DSM 6562 TaxID=1121431 RepID=A0A5S4ZYZ1_9FIRM|nr:pyridoxal phosphate-dependent aminotransferase [Desulfallas thermosapovorans]TYO97361.1 aspartate aminotransferase [Desulfallas thermosapovorans DSM 6562]